MVASSVAYLTNDAGGTAVPALPVSYGNSFEGVLPVVATQIHNNVGNQIVRVWAIGTEIYFKFGVAALTAPTAADAYCSAGGYVDVPLTTAQQYFRAVVRSGSGSARVELLGT